jgi:Zn-dependent protease with chaperone function
MDYLVESYIETLEIKDELIQEFEPISGSIIAAGAIVGGISVVVNIISVLLAVANIKRETKLDKKWSERLNKILGTNDWRVHKIPDKVPNAFSVGGKYVFITTGLEKMMTQREVEAIMLHEVYHSEAKHVPKKLAYESPFFFMVVFIAFTTWAAAGIPFLGIIIYLLLRSVPNIAYAWLAGKRYELKADENAIKYGYQDEIISSLKKMENEMRKATAHMECGLICRAVNKIDEAIDEHPPVRKRVENVLRKSKELAKLAKTKNITGIKNLVMGVFKQ